MSDANMPGYDSAQKTRESDDLSRWGFAAEIAEVIRSTPPDWSARVGIFGKWGEGKSTVLHFLESMLRPEGNIVFYFNPWVVRDLDELWAEFGKSLLEALENEQLVAESLLKGTARKLQKKLRSTNLAEFGEGAAELFGKDKLYKGALGLIGKWLKPDGPQIKKIREKLGEKLRVVVFIDDLDRANPELLPKLLLSLREILDLPGFTFVLAFDSEIVAKGLVTANEAWGDGDSFLDKILDFSYYLPLVSKAGKRMLLKNMLERYGKFVPETSVDAIEHLLPDNPRKLKRLVRGLVSLKPQLARHGEDELNWVEIWLAEMVRQESYSFFVCLLEGDTLDELVGIGYKILKKSEGKEAGNDDVKKIINKVGGINENQTERLIELINAARTLGGHNLAYNWKLALRPDAITWKEFYEFLAQWDQNQVPATILTWIAKQSERNSIDQADVEKELFQTLLNSKHNAASEAAEASTTEENAVYCAKAAKLLRTTEQFLSLPGTFTAERFEMLYGKSLYWIAFRVNPADRKLRQNERELLLSLCQRATDVQAPSLLEALKPWDPYAFTPADPDTMRLKKELRDECVTLLLPNVARAFSLYLARPESIRLLRSPQSSASFQYVFGSLPWIAEVRNALLDVLHKAKSNLNEYEKTNELMQALIDSKQNRSFISPNLAKKLVDDREFVRALWSGATSRHIQFRMRKSYLAKWNALIELGAREEDLPLSSELAAASESPAAVTDVAAATRSDFEDSEDTDMPFEDTVL